MPASIHSYLPPSIVSLSEHTSRQHNEDNSNMMGMWMAWWAHRRPDNDADVMMTTQTWWPCGWPDEHTDDTAASSWPGSLDNDDMMWPVCTPSLMHASMPWPPPSHILAHNQDHSHPVLCWDWVTAQVNPRGSFIHYTGCVPHVSTPSIGTQLIQRLDFSKVLNSNLNHCATVDLDVVRWAS